MIVNGNLSNFTSGIWQKDAVLMVIGELNPKESKTVENFAPIQKFTASGGSVLLIKSKTEQIFPNIGKKLYCKSHTIFLSTE